MHEKSLCGLRAVSTPCAHHVCCPLQIVCCPPHFVCFPLQFVCYLTPCTPHVFLDINDLQCKHGGKTSMSGRVNQHTKLKEMGLLKWKTDATIDDWR